MGATPAEFVEHQMLNVTVDLFYWQARTSREGTKDRQAVTEQTLNSAGRLWFEAVLEK